DYCCIELEQLNNAGGVICDSREYFPRLSSGNKAPSTLRHHIQWPEHATQLRWRTTSGVI
ncbi:hypothetical protein, partial [Oleiphilus sp. HI0080]|uniref:hypothetical protein n=1 Tax=Oleiphilus sp. HI0080 TaxID=1822255 RepID=UPI001E2AB175